MAAAADRCGVLGDVGFGDDLQRESAAVAPFIRQASHVITSRHIESKERGGREQATFPSAIRQNSNNGESMLGARPGYAHS